MNRSNDLYDYFENKCFVKWVFDPDDELNNYWERYLSENPAEREQIAKARAILQQFNSKQDSCGPDEYNLLYSKIINQLGQKSNPRINRRYYNSVIKYAAFALILMSFGTILFYQHTKNNYYKRYSPLSDLKLDHVKEARLILSDGKEITLQERESIIQHQEQRKVVINNVDTIQLNKEIQETEINKLIVPYGKNSSIRLPDNTLVYLNAGSVLMYPNLFRGEIRKVYLVGEAYFEVANNPAKPFVVKTKDVTITALGTVFNVVAYPSENIIKTILVEGKVAVRDDSFRIRKREVILEPKEMAIFNRESLETTVKQVDLEYYGTWRNQYLNFFNEELNHISAMLERYYNITILLDNIGIGQLRVTGKLGLNEDIEKTIEVLTSTANVRFRQINEKTYIIY